jgi:hypothetical protein
MLSILIVIKVHLYKTVSITASESLLLTNFYWGYDNDDTTSKWCNAVRWGGVLCGVVVVVVVLVVVEEE